MPIRRSKYREQGQSLVEVALTLPLLLFILSVVLDLGRIYYTFIALEDAANEAALFLTSTNPWCRFESDTPPLPADVIDQSAVEPPLSCQDPRNAFYRARNSGVQEVDWSIVRDRSLISFLNDDGAVYLAQANDIEPGAQIEVRIEYPFELITPIIREISERLNGGPIPLTATSKQTILNIDT